MRPFLIEPNLTALRYGADFPAAKPIIMVRTKMLYGSLIAAAWTVASELYNTSSFIIL
jgi:hypothetical protein